MLIYKILTAPQWAALEQGGDLFPQLHAALRRADVAWARPLPLDPDGAHVFPEGVGA